MAYRVRFREEEVLLPPGESIIGRDKRCRIRLDDPAVSRRHARLLVVDERLVIEDVKSLNGFTVNGELVTGPTPLNDGDKVVLCGHELHVIAEMPSMEWRLEPTLAEGEVAPELMAYQAPVCRTCRMCRKLVEPEDSRCPACGSEMAVFDPDKTTRIWHDPHGRRSHPRAEVSYRGLFVSSTVTQECAVSDLSLGGAFVAVDMLDAPGTACDLLVFPTPDGDVIRIASEVARVVEGDGATGGRTGMGLRFLRMTVNANRWLREVVEPAKS